MRRIITATVLVVLLFAGAYFLSEKVFKQPQNQMTGITFVKMDEQGQAALDLKMTHEEGKAMVFVGGTQLGDLTYEKQVDVTLFKSAEDLVDKLSIATWKNFSTKPVDVPAGQFGVLITYADGSCICANSEGLSADAAKKAVDQVTSWASDLIEGRLGITGNPLLDLFNL